MPEGWQLVFTPADSILLGPEEERAVSVKVTAPDGFVGRQAINVNAFDGEDLVSGATLYAEISSTDVAWTTVHTSCVEAKDFTPLSKAYVGVLLAAAGGAVAALFSGGIGLIVAIPALVEERFTTPPTGCSTES